MADLFWDSKAVLVCDNCGLIYDAYSTKNQPKSCSSCREFICIDCNDDGKCDNCRLGKNKSLDKNLGDFLANKGIKNF